MIRFKTDTQEKYEKMLGQVESKMIEYKKRYEGENVKCEEMRERIEKMEEDIESLEKLNQTLQQSAAKESAKVKENFAGKITKYEEQM